MLILIRKLGEKIIIGEGPTAATITVLEVRGGLVRLGVEAARNVPIWREEVRPQELAGPTAK